MLRCVIVVLFLIFDLVCFTSCSETNANLSTTTAGQIDYVTLSGNAVIELGTGKPFTQSEIENADVNENFSTEKLGSSCKLSNKGYHHILVYKDNQLDFSYLKIPIVKDRLIIASITLHRKEDGTIEDAGATVDYGDDYLLNQLLTDYPNEEIVMIYSQFSEYAITSDNIVHTIYGNDNPVIENPENIYNAYKTEYNTISSKIFDIES